MSKGIFALFGVTKRTSLRTVDSFGRTFNMPYVTPSAPERESGLFNAFTLYLRPLYHHALIDIVKLYGWTKVFYIYHTPEGKKTYHNF